jgi:hypothetical protein
MITTLLSLFLILGSAQSQAPPANADSDLDLVAALQDQDPDIRALAAELLADEPAAATASATDALLSRVTDSSEGWRVRVAAAEALGRQSRDDVEVTGRLVDLVIDMDEDWRVRGASLSALRDRDEGRLLLRSLAGREECSISNGHSRISLTHPLSDDSVFQALTDPDPRMRTLARAALDTSLKLVERRAEVPVSASPCFSQVLQQVLGQTSSTGALSFY